MFEFYRIFYLNILLFILFYSNQFFLFFLVLFYKIPYILNFESDIEYQFDFIYLNWEDIDARYLENDIDNEYFYVLTHIQSYLYSDCRFFFDILGGETLLDYLDFLDFTIYKYNDAASYFDINRNYKYIYINDLAYLNIKNMSDAKIYQMIDNYYNDNYYKKTINDIKNFNANINKIINQNDIKKDIIKLKEQL